MTERDEKNGLRFREAAQPWERIYIGFFVGVFVTAIAAVPIAMYGLEALESNLELLGAVVLTFLLSMSFAFGLLFLLRKRLSRRLGLPPPGLLRDVYDPLVAGLEALRSGQLETAYVELKSATAAGVSFYGWMVVRWWMIRTSVALIGVFATVAGTALLFRHNELVFDQNQLIVDQNRKINEQNLRLRVQNKLLLAQTDVEVRQQFSQHRGRIHELKKLILHLQRTGADPRAQKVDVRWCEASAASCSDWTTIERNVDVCRLVTPPKDPLPCADVSTLAIRSHQRQTGTWSPEHANAHAALQVLEHLDRSLKVDGVRLERELHTCGVDDSAVDRFTAALQKKQQLSAVVSTLLDRAADVPGNDEVAHAIRELTIGELSARLHETQAGILQELREFSKQCTLRLVDERQRLLEAEKQQEALAQEVLE
ncbi:hypothetical protein ACFL5O_10295 [Myxococcota bacterium]